MAHLFYRKSFPSVHAMLAGYGMLYLLVRDLFSLAVCIYPRKWFYKSVPASLYNGSFFSDDHIATLAVVHCKYSVKTCCFAWGRLKVSLTYITYYF